MLLIFQDYDSTIYITLFLGMASQKQNDWSKGQVFPASLQMSTAITIVSQNS